MAEKYRDPTANFILRLGAWIIDLVLVLAVVFAAQTFALSAGESFPGRPSACDASGNVCVNSGDDAYLLTGSDTTTYQLILVGAVVVALLNYVVLQGRAGATVGKFALGLRTVGKSSDRPAGMVRCLLRTLFSWIDFLFVGLVGIITYLTSKNHRRVADMIGGTIVVKKDYVAQQKVAAASAEAAAAETAARAAASKGAWKDTEPYPGAYGPSHGTTPSPSTPAPPTPPAPATPPAAPPGFPGATPPAGFAGTAPSWPPTPTPTPAEDDGEPPATT